MTTNRYLNESISRDLKDKMVFLGGPRQVGKTTLAQLIGSSNYRKYSYLNWDNRLDRQAILAQQFEADSQLVIFDEIHKYRQWKNYLKGEYDKYKEKFHVLVTGSARLDLYKKGGDSLMGRYHYYRLHPFSLGEVLGVKAKIEPFKELKFADSSDDSVRTFNELLKFGGFPEPFLKKDEKTLRRFHNQRLDRLVKEDIRDIESVRDLSSMSLLADILPAKVGSLFSMNSLREDLQVTHRTIAHWVDILERFYYHFRIYPFASSAIKSLRKEPKLYLCDWSQIEYAGSRLENLVGSHLLKTVHYLQDAEGYKVELNFLRDSAGREVDFFVSVNNQPWFAVEVKSSAGGVSKTLSYFRERLKIPFVYQVVGESGIDFWQDGTRIISADKFLTQLI